MDNKEISELIRTERKKARDIYEREGGDFVLGQIYGMSKILKHFDKDYFNDED